MSSKTFENYGTRVGLGLSPTEQAGRYEVQADAEKYIVSDVVSKLRPKTTDKLLEIGCGPGALLIPLSFMVHQSVGIDHEEVVSNLNKRFSDERLQTVGGNFLDIGLSEKFDCILIYSVLHCLTNEKEIETFVDKATGLLAAGGRLLLGDLPNKDLKARFINSVEGGSFSDEWERKSADDAERFRQVIEPNLQADGELATFDDAFICELLIKYRRLGFDSYLLPQPQNLPFGNTREDLLIVARDEASGV